MERIREKKLRDQNSFLNSTSSELSYENQNLESSIISQSISNSSELSSDNNSSCDSESKSPTNVLPNQRHETLCSTKIPYNQKVERGLRLELSICTKDDNQSARTIVYNEIKSLLPDITNVNLRKITSRAKKVYILYEGIGIDKISQITYSASAIASLKDIQIQNIINDFSKKLTDMNFQK